MTLAVVIEGLGFWAPGLAGWPAAAAALRDDLPVDPAAAVRRPSPSLLPPAERRRAPDTVALALEVAAEAVAAAGRDAARLPTVFASAHGDLPLLDAMCRTLATQPTLVSPTKFHNSVHNAAAGYWTIATGCGAASTAVAAGRCSFAAGLLEAALQCVADDRPVLLVGFDAASSGPLVDVAPSEGLLGVAMVLAPASASPTPGATPSPAATWHLSLRIGPALDAPMALTRAAARTLAGNALADALPLCEALAQPAAARLALPLNAHAGLHLHLTPLPR